MTTSASLPDRPARSCGTIPFRSGIGRFGKRPDLAALIVVLVFGAFANAAGMVGPGPGVARSGGVAAGTAVPASGDQPVLRLRPRRAACAAGRDLGGALPLVRADSRCRRWRWRLAFRMRWSPSASACGWRTTVFTSWRASDAATPALQRFAGDLGWAILGEPAWARACCRPVADWLPRLEILSLDVGLLLSLYSGYRIALTQSERASQALKMLAPWAVLIVLLFAAGVWIVLQPMQMRGTLAAAG